MPPSKAAAEGEKNNRAKAAQLPAEKKKSGKDPLGYLIFVLSEKRCVSCRWCEFSLHCTRLPDQTTAWVDKIISIRPSQGLLCVGRLSGQPVFLACLIRFSFCFFLSRGEIEPRQGHRNTEYREANDAAPHGLPA